MKKRTYEASNAAKRQICTVLKELMTQKTLNRITVAEIMRGLRHGAPAFYYHFDDVYDAVRWIFLRRRRWRCSGNTRASVLWQDGLLQLFPIPAGEPCVLPSAPFAPWAGTTWRFFQTDIRAIIRSTIRLIAAELGYEAGEQELTMLTQFYVGALVSIVEDWLLGEIQGTPEELIRFVDQVLRDSCAWRSALAVPGAGPGTAPLLEPDHCAGPVSK